MLASIVPPREAPAEFFRPRPVQPASPDERPRRQEVARRPRVHARDRRSSSAPTERQEACAAARRMYRLIRAKEEGTTEADFSSRCVWQLREADAQVIRFTGIARVVDRRIFSDDGKTVLRQAADDAVEPWQVGCLKLGFDRRSQLRQGNSVAVLAHRPLPKRR